MNGESIDAIIVRTQGELQERLYAGGSLMPGEVIANWTSENLRRHPHLRHVFLAIANCHNQTLLMSSNPQDGVSVSGNSGPVSVQIVAGNQNNVVGGAPLPPAPPAPHSTSNAASWPIPLLVFVVAAILAGMWFADDPHVFRISISIGVASAATVVALLRYLGFMRKTWEKHYLLGLSSLLVLDAITRSLGAQVIAKVATGENASPWILEAKTLIGETESGWVTVAKLAAAVLLAGFALRAKILPL